MSISLASPLTEELNVGIRVPEAGDVTDLHAMILESTGNKTIIKPNDLLSDLFVFPRFKHKPEVSDATLEIDPDLCVSNMPVVRAYLAEVDGKPVGYILYHHHYSPWIQHAIIIADVFVGKAHRCKGIARKLVDKVSKVCREEKMTYLIGAIGRLDGRIKQTILDRHNVKNLRGPETDWSVLRIDFQQ